MSTPEINNFTVSAINRFKWSMTGGTSAELKSTFTYLDAGGEQTLAELTTTSRLNITSIWLDLVNITQNATIKVYYKIDGTNYREVDSFDFTVATDSDGYLIQTPFGITDDFKVTYTEAVDEGADRDIPFLMYYNTQE